MSPPAPAERIRALLRSPRVRILLGLLLLAIAVRIALPYVLRPLLVEQADEALVGRIALADLDLSLIRGGVTLHGLEVRVDELPPAGAGSDPAQEAAAAASASTALPPVLEARQLWTQFSWLALLRKTIEVEEFDLDGFAVRIDRLPDGFRLPEPVPSGEPPEPEPEEPSGWSFAADAVAFRDGKVEFQDFTVGREPQRFEFAVKDISAENLALVIDAAGFEPGHVVINAQLGEGQLGLDARVEARAEGPTVVSKIALADLPIDGVRAYTNLGWQNLAGTLDASIEHRFETGGAHELAGTVTLSDVAVLVADLGSPALAWKRLGIEIEKLDFAKQSAAVSTVALEGARVALDPKAPQPVLLLGPPPPPGSTPPAPVKPPAEVDVESPKPWVWRVAKIAVTESAVDLLGAESPLPVAVTLEAREVASKVGSRWPVKLTLAPGAGSLAVDGALGVEPLAFDGQLTIADLALAPLLARSDTPAASWLRQGSLRSDLKIALTPRGAGADEVARTDLRVSGKLGLAGLDVAAAETEKDFNAAWKDFDVALGELTIPGLLGARDPAMPLAIGVKLERVRLVQPRVRITRTPQGIVLPAIAEAPTATASEAAAPPPAPAAPAPQAPEVKVEIADARIDAGRARIVDRSVKPLYDSTIDTLDLKARGVRWPGPYITNLVLDAKGLRGATLAVRGSVAPGDSQLEMKLASLPLAPFNPYVTPSGYHLSGGTLSIDSQATLEREAYDTSNKVVASQLQIGGSEGEARFQQNFGIPLSVAVGLLTDLNGRIALAVPVKGDGGGRRVNVGRVVLQALRKALIGALASPLKLVGAAITAGDEVQSVAPDPIECLAGRAEFADSGGARLEQLASLLSASPGIALTLRGATAPPDLRWLQEQALLAQLQASSGLRALGQLGEIGTRRAVRSYLEAKLAGGEAALEPEAEAWLEAQVARQDVPAAQLAALADARAAAARQALVAEYGVEPERLSLGPRVDDPPANVPGVTIALGAPPRAGP